MRTLIKLAAFKTATNNTSIVERSRGPKIELIDDALQAYETRSKALIQDHVNLLHGIVDACLTWLKLKRGKAIVTKGAFGRRIENKVFKKRKEEITKLANDALYNINELINIHGLATPDVNGKFRFNTNKLRTLGMNGMGGHLDRSKPLNPLSNGYQHERTTYLNEKKKTGHKVAISANQVHEVLDLIKDKMSNSGKINIPEEYSGGKKSQTYHNQLNNILSKDVNNLSDKDFEFLDELGRLNGNTKNFDFIAKQNRYQFMALPDFSGQLRDYQDNLITTQRNGNTAKHMYSMDKYGNLIHKVEGGIVIPVFNSGVKENLFNHSSFNAGGDVICAGMLKIVGGYLTEIDNNSGHYKPSRAQLHHCVSILHSDGVDFSRLKVIVLEFGTVDNQNFIDWKEYDGMTFFQNPDGALLLEVNRTFV